MNEVKHRGPQYFLFVSVILTGIAIGIYLKPKPPVKPKMMSKTTDVKKPEKKKIAEDTFEKITSADQKEDTIKLSDASSD